MRRLCTVSTPRVHIVLALGWLVAAWGHTSRTLWMVRRDLHRYVGRYRDLVRQHDHTRPRQCIRAGTTAGFRATLVFARQ